MIPRDYTVTLTIRSDVPIAVLRDADSYDSQIKDHANDKWYRIEILTVQVKEREPWDVELSAL